MGNFHWAAETVGCQYEVFPYMPGCRGDSTRCVKAGVIHQTNGAGSCKVCSLRSGEALWSSKGAAGAAGTAGHRARQDVVLPTSERRGDRGFHTCLRPETELVRAGVC